MQKNKRLLYIYLLLMIFLSSCSSEQKDRINLFDNFRLSQSKETVLQILTDKNLSYITTNDFSKDSSELTDEDKEEMPQDFFQVTTSIYGKHAIVTFHFWDNELYKIYVYHYYPFEETDKLKVNQDLLDTYHLFDTKIQSYFVSSIRKEYTDFLNYKHISFDIGLYENLDLEISEYSVTLTWIDKSIEQKVEIEKEKYKEMIKRQNPDYYGKWTIQNNEICYLTDIEGYFSNSITTNSPLSVICYIVKMDGFDNIEFRLYEYESEIVKSASWRNNSFFIYVTDLNTEKVVSGTSYLRGTEIGLGKDMSKQILSFLETDNPNVSFYLSEYDSDSKYEFILDDNIYGISKAMEKRTSYKK